MGASMKSALSQQLTNKEFMIVVDYSQILISNCLAHGADFNKGCDAGKMEQIARHTILTTLLSYKQQFGKKYGSMVIAADGKLNWRKDVFPHYKHRRKGTREDSPTDWQAIFTIGAQIREEIQELFPFRVVREDTAEADDVIAVLCKYTQENELLQEGLEETPQKFLAISTDGDFKQLYKYANYAQWSPMMRKAVARPERTFLLEKLIRGDRGDNIPSVLCPDDFFCTDYGRAAPITKKVLDKFMNNLSECSEIERARFDRNRTLIDFECIPKGISEKILHTYLTTTPANDKNAIFEYCIKNKLKNIISEIHLL